MASRSQFQGHDRLGDDDQCTMDIQHVGVGGDIDDGDLAQLRDDGL